MITLLYQDSWE